MNTKYFGSDGEHTAADVVRAKGGVVLDMNFHTRMGEIDVIAQMGEYIAFIEVKRRSSARFARPAEAVDIRKQARIIRAARQYLYEKHLEEAFVRFDVMEILPGEINWIENAFDATDVE